MSSKNSIGAIIFALVLASANNVEFAYAANTATPPVAKQQYADALRLIDVWLDAQRDFEHLSGLSAGVVIGQELIWAKGYGTIDAARTVSATPDTIYSICSISKLFTSVAIMQLVDAGKLRLDDDIAAVLPGFDMIRSDPDSGPITIRSMLSHSSGLSGEGGFANWMAPDFRFASKEELQKNLKNLHTMMRTSDHYQYSNLAMSLLGLVVEQVSGMTYEEYAQRHILTPLKLADTRTKMPMELYGTRLAQGFGPIRRDATRELFKPFDTGGYVGAAGYTSTVSDLAKFASWQFRLLKNGGSEILRVSSLRDMQRVQWTDPDGKTMWGLGFGVSYSGTTKIVGHNGLCPGYLSALSMVPKDELAVIVMTNNQVSINDYSRPMRALLEKGRALPPRATGKDAADLDAYAGIYSYRNRGGEQAIIPWGKGLAVVELPNRDPATSLGLLRHIKGDEFRYVRDDGSLGQEVTFKRNAAGKIIGHELEWHMSARLRGLP